ncbi:hypothetical protein V6N11_024230 [Hibiscus sabdariffa]|uniref:Uncharacterized protein n=2 Tax=Hibiscus sabdariffa TaxID=183260 RepID=A0ABR1ZU27_9ROSI
MRILVAKTVQSAAVARVDHASGGETSGRNSSSEWRFSFAHFIGICLVLDVELWGAYYILCYAWEAGNRQIVLEMDSLEAIRVLKDDFNGFHFLKWHLDELRGRDWLVRIRHMRRSGNKVANALAKSARLDSLETTYYGKPPSWLNSLLFDDVMRF